MFGASSPLARLAAAGEGWHEKRMQPRHPKLESAFALVRAGRVGEGLELVRALAAEDEPEALFTLAEIYWCGGPVAKDVVRGRQLFRQAAEAGHPLAQHGHTNLLASGLVGERDWTGALARLREEARSDPARARAFRLVERMDLTAEGDPASLPAGDRLSERPEVTLFRHAFSDAECDFLTAMAEPGYRPTMVDDGTGRYVRDPVRTSDGFTFHWLIEDPAIHALNRRLAALTGTTSEQGEPLQLLRYRPGQQYRPHMDWDSLGNARILTALVYLNEDYEGGETLFVRTGLEVKGRKGDALIFRSQAPDGGPDLLSEHAGLPVTRGTKFLASRWIHESRYED